MGFRGSKKNTPYAAQMAAQDCGKVAYNNIRADQSFGNYANGGTDDIGRVVLHPARLRVNLLELLLGAAFY